jgi:hypothetical protein
MGLKSERGKAIPVTVRGGVQSCQTSRLPYFRDNGSEVVRLMCRKHFIPWKILILIYVRNWVDLKGFIAVGRIRYIERKSNGSFGNGTRDVTTCSIPPQPTMLPRAHIIDFRSLSLLISSWNWQIYFVWKNNNMVLFTFLLFHPMGTGLQQILSSNPNVSCFPVYWIACLFTVAWSCVVWRRHHISFCLCRLHGNWPLCSRCHGNCCSSIQFVQVMEMTGIWNLKVQVFQNCDNSAL